MHRTWKKIVNTIVVSVDQVGSTKQVTAEKISIRSIGKLLTTTLPEPEQLVINLWVNVMINWLIEKLLIWYQCKIDFKQKWLNS